MNSERQLYKSRRWLSQRYYKDRRSLRDIATECGVCYQTVQYFLSKFGFKGRKRGWGGQEAISVYTRVPRHFFEALKEVCHKEKKKKAAIIKEALFEYFINRGHNPFKDN